MQLPESFKMKMQELLEEDYKDYMRCFDEKRHFGLRINTSKISVVDFLKIAPWDLKPIPWIENGFYYDGEKIQPAKHPFYHAGLFYLQEPTAMTPAYLLPIEPGDKVLDLCAAPGGKATEMGAKLAGTGLLTANDISHSRAKGLLKNIELMGIGNALVVSEHPSKLVNYFEEYFDKILIDAPCSGEGMFRKEPSMIKDWEEKGPEYYSKLQKEIIIQGAKMLKPGGLLMYSTCTFDPIENEQVIEYLLNSCPEFSIVEVKRFSAFSEGLPEYTEDKSEELRKTIRIYPHRVKGEGHYLALLGKCIDSGLDNTDMYKKYDDVRDVKKVKSENPTKVEMVLRGKNTVISERKTRKDNGVEIPVELATFINLIKIRIEIEGIYIKGEQVYYLPKEVSPITGLRFLRTGLYLGDLKKNRFEPSQALAMNLKKEEFNLSIDFEVKDNRVIKYLKGETLEVSELTDKNDKGWALICVEGYPLGFGKLSNGMLKNKYQVGWRLG